MDNEAYFRLISDMGTLIAEMAHCLAREQDMTPAVYSAVLDVLGPLRIMEQVDD